MNSKILLTAWTLVSAAMAAPDLAAAQAQVGAAGADSLDGLISLQTASDRMNIELDEVVRAAVARGVAERKSMSASRPIQNYLEAVKPTVAEPADASVTPPLAPEDIAPLVEKHLLLMEELERENLAQADAARGEVEAYANAKSNGVAVKLRTAAAIESWGRLVLIVAPGEVIENDPIDVAHARLEDLTRRREELQAELKTKPTSMAMRSILRELAGIDRQINAAIFQITGVVWFQRAGKGSICHPPAVKGRPVAWYNCEYWALNTPFVVGPAGAKITVDRVLIDVDEDERGLRSARIAFYTRAQGRPPSEEPSDGASGEFRHMADGSMQLIAKEVDDSGEERERAYPIELTTDEARGLIPGFAGYGPFKLKFRRDPKAYISWEEAEAISRGVVTSRGRESTTGSAQPAPPPPPAVDSEPYTDLAPLVPEPGDDAYLAPLVAEPGSKPPPPAPPPPPPAADSEPYTDLAPLAPEPGDDAYLAPLAPEPGDDAYLAPLTKPD